MNILFVSPHFPPNFYQFCIELKRCGASVLAIGDAPISEFREELKEAITEYCQIDMINYDKVQETVEYFIKKYGKISRVDSHNEFWLSLEARIRADFNIFGQKPEDLMLNQSKLGMKKVFKKAGVPSVETQLISSPDILHDFVKKYGFPILIKPDKGVGASNTYKIKNEEHLNELSKELKPGFIVEPFVVGKIVTFDGLTDRNGEIMFFASFELSVDVLSALQKQRDSFYYYSKTIDKKLESYGRRMVKGFNIKERFFHGEFFRTPAGDYLAIEINVRPPGGYALDMLNYSCDINLYKAWAELVVYNKDKLSYRRKYNVATVLRRDQITYAHSPDEVLSSLGSKAISYKRLPEIFAAAMGNDTFILRHQELDPLLDAVSFSLEKA